MSSKEIVSGLLERIPDEASLHDIAAEIEFIAGVREGFESHEREGGVTVEEARTELTSWIPAAVR